jgi:hypothetical protein
MSGGSCRKTAIELYLYAKPISQCHNEACIEGQPLLFIGALTQATAAFDQIFSTVSTVMFLVFYNTVVKLLICRMLP